MTLSDKTKKILAVCGAGVAGAILLGVCCVQCATNNEMEKTLNQADVDIENTRNRLDSLKTAIDSLVNKNRELEERDRVLGESLIDCQDENDLLRDSLRDARKKRPVRNKKRPVTPCPGPQPVVVPDNDKKSNTVPVVSIDNGAVNNGNITINNGDVINNYITGAPENNAQSKDVEVVIKRKVRIVRTYTR